MRTAGLRTAWGVVAWLGVALIIYLSLMHDPPQLDVAEGDKLQHVAAYAALTLWWMQLWVTRTRRGVLAAALLALGIALEFVQGTTGYRTFSVADMGADAIGVALGWLAAPPRLPSLLQLAQRLVR